MSRLIHAAALGLFGCATLAHAEDSRLVHKLFDPGAIVRIEGKPSVQATIRFGEDELIENVAIGNSNAWQVTPNKRANLLFVKPLAEKAATNMTVVTNAHTYFFDLVASPKAANPLYELAFTYPQEAKTAARKTDAAAGTTVPTDVELAAASDPAAVSRSCRPQFRVGRQRGQEAAPEPDLRRRPGDLSRLAGRQAGPCDPDQEPGGHRRPGQLRGARRRDRRRRRAPADRPAIRSRPGDDRQQGARAAVRRAGPA